MNELAHFLDLSIFLQGSTWVALLTLVILEVVLGVDNLVFIAILSNRLPYQQRKKARVIGLSLALFMRIGLLCIMSVLMRLKDPIFVDPIFHHGFSVQNFVMLFGGFFLLWKATSELHERLEGAGHDQEKTEYLGFWVVVTQIIVLDAVFSLDAVITAQHMSEHLLIMIIAVGISMILMIFAAGWLTEFLNRYPTIVILCLSFLLMIGLSLIAEGFGAHIPKNYLYAAIGFSVLIEIFNQISQRNIQNRDSQIPMRARVANRILSALSTVKLDESQKEKLAFAEEERFMVSSVLSLSQRNVRSIMTPRNEMDWINIEDDPERVKKYIIEKSHTYFPLCKGNIDDIIGIAKAKDLLFVLSRKNIPVDYQKIIKEPLLVHRSTSILKMIETFRASKEKIVIVIDEFGSIQGLLSLIDVFESIAGEFPDKNESASIIKLSEEHWQIEGSCDLHVVEQTLGLDRLMTSNEEDYSDSLAGFLLAKLGDLPEIGQSLVFSGYLMTIIEADDKRIIKVDVKKQSNKKTQSSIEVIGVVEK